MAVYDWINGESVLVSDEEQALRDAEWWATHRYDEPTDADKSEAYDILMGVNT